jgi:hypothetical protein
MELGVSLLHQRNPELVLIGAKGIEWAFLICPVGNARIYNHMLPLPVFEKLKDSESMLNTIVHNKVAKHLWMSGQH